MPRSRVLSATRSVQLPTGLPAPDDKVRVTAIEAEILEETRPAMQGIGEQLRKGGVKVALILDILDERWADAHRRLGKLSGLDIPNGYCERCGAPGIVEGAPSGKPLPARGDS